MKTENERTSKCENINNWNAELSFMRVVHFSAYACKKTHNLRFANVYSI